MKTVLTLMAALFALAFLQSDGNAADTPKTVSKVKKSLLTGQETRIITTIYPRPSADITKEEAETASKASRGKAAYWLKFGPIMSSIQKAHLLNEPRSTARDPRTGAPQGTTPLLELWVVISCAQGGTAICSECQREHDFTRLAVRRAAIYEDGGIIPIGRSYPAFAAQDFDPATKFVWSRPFWAEFRNRVPHVIQNPEIDKKTGEITYSRFAVDSFMAPLIYPAATDQLATIPETKAPIIAGGQ